METDNGDFQQLEKSMTVDREMAGEVRAEQTSWLRYLVTTISVLFGILVALGEENFGSGAARWLFASAASLLALSILAFLVSLYSDLYYLRQKRRLHAEETRRAYRECRRKNPIVVREKAVFSVCETIGYICFSAALLVLCVFLFVR